MIPKQRYNIYIASCDVNGGVYQYIINERGKLKFVKKTDLEIKNTYSTLPAGFHADNAAAAIRISNDGKYLYVSNRGHNSIACFEILKDELISIGIESCKGDSPRDFDIIGDYLISTNENSNTVTVFKMENGKMCNMTDEIKLDKALCVVSGMER